MVTPNNIFSELIPHCVWSLINCLMLIWSHFFMVKYLITLVFTQYLILQEPKPKAQTHKQAGTNEPKKRKKNWQFCFKPPSLSISLCYLFLLLPLEVLGFRLVCVNTTTEWIEPFLFQSCSSTISFCSQHTELNRSDRSEMADQLSKAEEFEKKAEKKLNGWGLFGSKYEDASDLFDKAANSFKLAKSCIFHFPPFFNWIYSSSCCCQFPIRNASFLVK